MLGDVPLKILEGLTAVDRCRNASISELPRYYFRSPINYLDATPTSDFNMKHLQITPGASGSPLRDAARKGDTPETLPEAKEVKVHPSKSGDENASIYFVGTATTIM